MAKASRYLAGNYINVDYIRSQPDGRLVVTVDHVSEDTIQNEDKLVMYFAESHPGLPLNNSRIEQMLALTNGQDDTDSWRGLRVELYVDAAVKFGGKRVGGVSLRAAPAAAAAG